LLYITGKPLNFLKTPARPHTTRASGADRDGAPRLSGGERGGGISEDGMWARQNTVISCNAVDV